MTELWGFRNRWVFLPVLSVLIHFSILYAGSFYQAYCFSTVIFKDNTPSLGIIISYFFSYSGNFIVDLRTIVLVGCFSDGLSYC